MKWFKGNGWEYIEFLKQFPSAQGKKFIGFRPTMKKGFEVIVRDEETSRYWMINECRDDFRICEDDTEAWNSMSKERFVFCDDI